MTSPCIHAAWCDGWRTYGSTSVSQEAPSLNPPPLYPTGPADYFRIRVIDAETKRGVPLVELRTNSCIPYQTDSAGVVAFFEPGLMDRDVFFHVQSHGYSIDGMFADMKGRLLRTTPGTTGVIEIVRVNIARRLYRITGQGIYIHSLLLGDPVPLRHPLHNRIVDGQDSVLTTRYKDRLFWIWGDTSQPGHSIEWNFKVTGALSDPPDKGGLDPEVGVDLEYFGDDGEFTRKMVPLPKGNDLHWIGSLFVVDDNEGRPRLMAGCAQVVPPLTGRAYMLLQFNDEKGYFEPIVLDWPNDGLKPNGHAIRHTDGGQEYFVFPAGGGFTRVRAIYDDVRNPDAYEAWTCLKQGGRTDKSGEGDAEVERDAEGALVWGWKKATSPFGQAAQAKLEKEGRIRHDERTFCLYDVDTGKPVQTHSASIYWNEYRKRWINILSEHMGGPSMLGEIWYAESDRLTGPYVYTRRVVTHHRYSFYNPLQHPEFSKDGGRILFFEGTYTTWFSGVEKPTPRYDYNQIMYNLELDDERLLMPVPVYRADARARTYRTAAEIPPGAPLGDIAFFALDRPRRDTVSVYEVADGSRSKLVAVAPGDPPPTPNAVLAFHALPPDFPGETPAESRGAEPVAPAFDATGRENASSTAAKTSAHNPMIVPLFEYANSRTKARVYATHPPASPSPEAGLWTASPSALCRVWRNPLSFPPPESTP